MVFRQFFKIISLFLMLVIGQIAEAQVVERRTSWLFSHGMWSALQVAKYAPFYQPSTGDVLEVEHKDFKVIGEPLSAFWYPEIVLNTNGGVRLSLGSTGLRPKIDVIFDRLNEVTSGVSSGISFVSHVTDGPTLKNYSIALTRANCAQDDDIAALSSAYDEHVQRYPGHDLVLFGASRGASTIFNFLATTYESKQDKLVKAAVLDGCFDELTVARVGSFFIKQAKITQLWLHSYLFRFCRKVSRFNPKGIMPIKVVAQYPKDTPTLFVASKKDKVVPFEATEHMYHQLKKQGHPDVYLLTLENSNHCAGMKDDPVDKTRYEVVVNAFYKKYHLDHDQELAEQGMSILLNECRPN